MNAADGDELDSSTQSDILERIGLPYPGLRPFQPDESEFFFGRDRQTREIIGRLASKNHFVAIVGGSGSGKSSLMRAGVIPWLRGYEFKAAGGNWVSIVSTPGTNPFDPEHRDSRREGPLYRLAEEIVKHLAKHLWRYRSDKDEQKRADHAKNLATKRVDWIVRTLRSTSGLDGETVAEGGFSKIVRCCGKRLDPELYPAPQETNFLFLLDQFEELFHSSHDAWLEDETLLAQVVLHANKPHGLAYLVLTMRSEHLNDCQKQEGLPDAINKGIYLLSRLGEHELREVIEEPVRRMLVSAWKLARENPELAERLPKNIVFDEDVTSALLAAAEELRSKPDHLPLLQHLLYRLWEAAYKRTRDRGKLLPLEITTEDMDLACKVDWRSQREEPLLTEVLNWWCEKLFADLDDGNKKRVEFAFRHLAIVDSVGNFTQQRISLTILAEDMEEWERSEGNNVVRGPTPEDLRGLLSSFVTPHKYLLTDDALEWDRAKVAHESLIRSWKRFNKWIAGEYETFKEFAWLVDQSKRWREAEARNEKQKELLSPGDLERYEALHVRRYLACRSQWLRFSTFWARGQHRRTDEHTATVTDPRTVAALIQSSKEAQRRGKNRYRIGLVCMVGAVGLFIAWVFDGIRRQLLTHEAAYSQSFAIATTTLRNFQPEFRHADRRDRIVPLQQELVAANKALEVREARKTWLESIARGVGLGDRVERLDRTQLFAEFHISERLWFLLTRSHWTEWDGGGARPVIQTDQCVKLSDGPDWPSWACPDSGNNMLLVNSEGESISFPAKTHPDFSVSESTLAISIPENATFTDSTSEGSSTPEWGGRIFREIAGWPRGSSTPERGNLLAFLSGLRNQHGRSPTSEWGNRLEFRKWDVAVRRFGEPQSSGPWPKDLPPPSFKSVTFDDERWHLGIDGKVILIPDEPRLMSVNVDGTAVSKSQSVIPIESGESPDSRCDKEREESKPAKQDKFCVEIIRRSTPNPSLAILYRLSWSNGKSRAYPQAYFRVGNDAKPGERWFVVGDDDSQKDEHPMPGWLYYFESPNSSGRYLAYPWGLRARSKIAESVLERMKGCVETARPDLWSQYSTDYDFIVNGPDSSRWAEVVRKVCEKQSKG